jgi:hypothetical protein
MTTKQILEAMTKGAILCVEYNGPDKVFWIEPRRVIVRSDVAEKIIGLRRQPLKDAPAQTWRLAGAA